MPAIVRHDFDDPDAYDERGILKDGHAVVVRSMLRDATATPARLTDAERAALDSCKPGYRFATDSAAAREAHQRARESYRQVALDLENSWRNPDPDGQLGIAEEGDQCTVRSGGSDEGSPGHLRSINGQLVCVPDSQFDARSMRDATERAYEQYAAELRDAWKTGK